MTETGTPCQRTVLVADDEPDLITLARYRLTRAGYRVIVATDGRQAVSMTSEQLPDLVVLDVMMPYLTGIEVLGVLRSDPRTGHIPVVLISAGFEIELVDPDVLSSANAYIKKPFSPTELTDCVDSLLHGDGPVALSPRAGEPT